jgi:hypothetical protein
VTRDTCPACTAPALDRWRGQIDDDPNTDALHAECGACGYIE